MSIQPLIIGKTNYRYTPITFGISAQDRLLHLYIIGRTGTGKTTLLENFIKQDIKAKQGLVFLDPHGDAVDKIYSSLSPQDKERVIYFNIPNNIDQLGYNPIRTIPPEKQALAVSGVLEIFRKMWDDAWGARLEHILRNCLFTLYSQPSATFADILLLLHDKKFRQQALTHVKNDQIKQFWLTEYDRYSVKFRAMAIAPIQNKVGAFLANPIINQVLTKPKVNLSLRSIMDEGKILLVNLSKGELGEDASHLLGGLLVTSLGLAAYSRANIPESERVPCTLYADEFQNFATLAFVNMASELRKYKISLVLAHQYLHQLNPDILEGVLSNAGTLICFRLGASDAVTLEKEFEPTLSRTDLMNLENYKIYLKLMINGKPSLPFSADTLSSIS